MTEKQRIPAWLGTAVAIITLCLGLAVSWVDLRTESAVLERRVESLEVKHTQDAMKADRLKTVETMVCLIGAHLKVAGLDSGECHRAR